MKKILVFGTLALFVGMAAYGKNKVTQVKEIVDNLSVFVRDIKNLKFNGKKVNFTLDVVLRNNTSQSFAMLQQSLVKITKVKVFKENGKLLVEADTDISGIDLRPQSETIIQDIAFESDYLMAVTEYLKNQFKGNYKVELTIDAFGKEWVVS